MKITYLVERMGPYHAFRLSGVTNHALSIIETRPESDRYAWQESISLNTLPLPAGSTWIDLWELITETQPKVIFISGYGFTEMLWGMAWAVKHDVPIVMLSDTTVQDEPKLLIKEKIKSFIISNIETALVAGKASKRYLISLGFREDRIFEPYDIVDNDFYAVKSGFRPFLEPYFLSISRLIPYKNIEFLIDTFTKYFSTLTSPVHLVILGNGELEEKLKQQIHSLGMESYIHIKGFLINTDVRAYYQSAISLVLVSKSEAWGLCINEAMAAGIPVIATNIAGATMDLIIENETGFSFSPTDQAGLIYLLDKVQNLSLAERFRVVENAKEKIKKYSLPHFVDGYNRSAALALSLKRVIPMKETLSKILLQISKFAK